MAELYKIDTNSPDTGLVARHVKVTLKYTTSELWRIETIRLLWSRRQHVLPKWLVPVNRLLKRTKVTLKYTGSDLWRIDAVRLKQMIKNRRPQV
jgi:hypothetical protein